jgi:hypothetical protein
MKIIFVFFAAILFILSGSAAKAENGDKHPAKIAVHRLLYRHSTDGMSLNQLVDRDCKELGVSRDEIRRELINTISTSKQGGKNEGTDTETKRNDSKPSSAAWFGMRLYPGDPQLESAILNGFRMANEQDTYYVKDYLGYINNNGSVELIEECKQILADSNKNQYLKYLSPSNRELHRSAGHEMKSDSLSVVVKAALLMVTILGLGCVVYGFRAKRRIFWICGSVTVIGAICIYCIASSAKSSTPNPGHLNGEKKDDGKGQAEHAHAPAIIDTLPASNTAEAVSWMRNKRSTHYEKVLQDIRDLMAPFNDLDPLDYKKNLKERETASVKLLEILQSGVPDGCSDENWTLVVRQIIGLQEVSADSMDRALKMVESWIADPQRKEHETMTALMTMIRWKDTAPIQKDSPEYKRFERMAGLYDTYINQATQGTGNTLLSSLAQATKNIIYPKSINEEPLVSNEDFLDIVNRYRHKYLANPSVQGDALIAICNRLRKNPEALPIFNDDIQGILGVDGVNATDRLAGFEALSSYSKAAGVLPTWINDTDIARQITTMRDQMKSDNANLKAYERPDYLFYQRVVTIINRRVSAGANPPVNTYNKLLLDMLGDTSVDPSLRLEAVRIAVDSGVITADEVNHLFSNEPTFGEKLKKLYPRK